MPVNVSRCILIVITTVCIAGQGFSLECAVCLPANDNALIAKEIRLLFQDSQTDLINCHQVNRTNEHNIIRTCPLNSTSCHIQKTKDWVAKTCSKIPVDSCITANDIDYCYCKTSLCNLNGHGISTTTKSSTERTTIYTTVSVSYSTETELPQTTIANQLPSTKSAAPGLSQLTQLWKILQLILFVSHLLFSTNI